jgi:ATP-independent RNA helicase DbpA
VVAATPTNRQTLLFSATWPDTIRGLSATLQRAPATVTVDNEITPADVEELFFHVDDQRRTEALAQLLLQHRPESALVFCQTRNDVRDVAAELVRRGFAALALHGDLEQRQREEALLQLANRSCTVLVATDVAARGLDIRELGAVICFEPSQDPDSHQHRIGRTGRAGHRGLALTLCGPREQARIAALEARRERPVTWQALPFATDQMPAAAPMATLCIDGGRQDKLRPADLLGALTGEVALPGDAIGKITIGPQRAYVAVRRDLAANALRGLRNGRIKGRSFRVARL